MTEQWIETLNGWLKTAGDFAFTKVLPALALLLAATTMRGASPLRP